MAGGGIRVDSGVEGGGRREKNWTKTVGGGRRIEIGRRMVEERGKTGGGIFLEKTGGMEEGGRWEEFIRGGRREEGEVKGMGQDSVWSSVS